MNKRLFLIFFVFLLVQVFVFVSCRPQAPCDHSWYLLENTDNVYRCSLCGEVKVVAKPKPQPCQTHDWVLQSTTFDGVVNAARRYVCPICGENKTQKVKNIVLVIGDGMGLEHIAAGQLASEKAFAFAQWNSASVNTDCVDATTGNATKTTDSAAAATAMATGNLTYKRYLGKDVQGNDLTTIMDIAAEYGMKTGFVTTDKPYAATPAGFSAHTLDRDNREEIVLSALQSDLNLMCGYTSVTVASKAEEIFQNGYALCDDFDNRNDVLQSDKAICMFDLEGYGQKVKLCEATEFALDYLDNENGFMLMVEQAHVDKFSHSNDFAGMVEAVNSLNDTVETILSWVGDRDDTAIFVTADHETGDLSVSSKPTLPHSFDLPSGNNVYYRWTQTSHSDSDVGLFYYGFDADLRRLPYFHSDRMVKNTDVFVLMNSLVEAIHKTDL